MLQFLSETNSLIQGLTTVCTSDNDQVRSAVFSHVQKKQRQNMNVECKRKKSSLQSENATHKLFSLRPCWWSQTIKDICKKKKKISQRKIVLLFRSSNMAALNILHKNWGLSQKRNKRLLSPLKLRYHINQQTFTCFYTSHSLFVFRWLRRFLFRGSCIDSSSLPRGNCV